MRHGSSGRRSRNRGNNRNSGQNSKTRVYDSNGPDVRIRGTAHQVAEKYMALAKDATGAGDHVLAESYLQHAEHYQRVISGWLDTVDESLANSSQEHLGDTRYDKRPKVKRVRQKQDDLGLPASITGKNEQGEMADA